MVWRLSRGIAEVGFRRRAAFVLKYEHLAVAVYVGSHVPVIAAGSGRRPDLSVREPTYNNNAHPCLKRPLGQTQRRHGRETNGSSANVERGRDSNDDWRALHALSTDEGVTT